MNKYFLLQMFLVIIQYANFTLAVFFTSSPFLILFAGAVLPFLCILAFVAWEHK